MSIVRVDDGKVVVLDEKEINQLFENAKSQEEYVLGLLKMVYPEWDRITKIEGFTKAEHFLAHRLMGKAVAFDKEHHPDVFNGGLWMNYGFSQAEHGELQYNEVKRQPFEMQVEVVL